MGSKYKAFISYSHTDIRWAKWLQRALERYRIPGRLADSVPAGRELPKRLYPIFRDTSELSSSSDLGAALKQSLRDSEYLVVICSPAAATSRWLNEEVIYYQSLGRRERILCFMVDGRADVEAKDCAFPPGLIERDEHGGTIEHLAADPRTDGKRDALLKIVGGILGVGIDDLKQRDAQRRARVWAGIASGAMVLAVAMIGLALYAISARNEADLRRGQAENLIGFMLGDLRQRLEPIGRLDVLDAVGDEAMEYFEVLDSQATPSDLLSRAMALRQIGEVRFNQGQLEPALQAFIESRLVLERLFRTDEGVDDYLFELGQSEFWVGYVYYERAQFEQSLEAMNNYLDISLALLERQPDNQDYLAELSYAYSNLGSVANGRGDKEAAIGYFRDSVAVSQRQLEAAPGDAGLIEDLAGGYSWIGTAEQNLGNLAAAEVAFRDALAQFDQLAQGADNARYLERRASSASLLADILLIRGKLDESFSRASFAYEEFGSLVERDPANNRWKRGLAKSASDLAELSHYRGAPGAADEYLAMSLLHFEELVGIDPSNLEWRTARLNLVELETRIRYDRDPADEELLGTLQTTYEALATGAREIGSSVNLLGTRARVANVYANVLMAADRRDNAIAVAREVYEEIVALREPPVMMQAYLLPLAEFLGEDDAVERLSKAVQAAGLAHPWLKQP